MLVAAMKYNHGTYDQYKKYLKSKKENLINWTYNYAKRKDS